MTPSTDPCLGAPAAAFEVVLDDERNYFTVYRCRAHGVYFLCDVQTGIGWYERFFAVGELEDTSPAALTDLWWRHHRMSNDELTRRRGRHLERPR